MFSDKHGRNRVTKISVNWRKPLFTRIMLMQLTQILQLPLVRGGTSCYKIILWARKLRRGFLLIIYCFSITIMFVYLYDMPGINYYMFRTYFWPSSGTWTFLTFTFFFGLLVYLQRVGCFVNFQKWWRNWERGLSQSFPSLKKFSITNVNNAQIRHKTPTLLQPVKPTDRGALILRLTS
jgi:hypothetical protein